MIKGYNKLEISIYLKAFDYFCQNPTDFDGATVVKDLQDLPKLDLDAMLHDYQYSVQNVAATFYTKWYSDWLYAKGQERKGKGQYSSFSRFIGLTLIGIGFVPYANYKRGSITLKQKKEFLEDYKTLMN
ncbi:hypothetical protein RT99_05910 [Flavobacterium sp. MEB061]|uniref:hypothetical protein n=1 Tax=Flavobacterium sp. MEB061 TaxID=1587524 RepID=UPI0005B6DFBF|nr:hypothetical protein [Flavobacterium sp. MEB061]KIQ22642.1 hypothetical protein RT99_05910 [Flavobacterium sp. MEB061]